jgi:hypothetical protein
MTARRTDPRTARGPSHLTLDWGSRPPEEIRHAKNVFPRRDKPGIGRLLFRAPGQIRRKGALLDPYPAPGATRQAAHAYGKGCNRTVVWSGWWCASQDRTCWSMRSRFPRLFVRGFKAAIGDLPDETPSSFITLYWSGRGKLWKIYWVYGTFVGWLLVPIYILAARSGIPVRGISGALLPYRVWVLVSVWRCAFNAENRVWGHVPMLTTKKVSYAWIPASRSAADASCCCCHDATRVGGSQGLLAVRIHHRKHGTRSSERSDRLVCLGPRCGYMVA